MISLFKQKIFQTFNIDMETAKRRALVPGENAIITAATEMVGEKLLKKYNIFDKLFPNNTGYKKITNKKQQKAGVDYVVFNGDDETYIDIKVCVGPDYSIKPEDFNNQPQRLISSVAVPVEIYQNNVFTNVKGKLTDYVLYLIIDQSGYYFYMISYDELRQISLEHKIVHEVDNNVIVKRNKGKYKWHTSNNGSGCYIKIPVMAVKLN